MFMKDGSIQRFEDRGAPGGSYCNEIDYKGSFVVITNPHGVKTAIPSEDIARVVQETTRYR